MEAYPVRKDRVGADDDVADARRQALERAIVGAAGLEARDGLYPHGGSVEARRERLEVLLGQNRRGREHRDLLGVHGRYERRAHGDLRLAVAGVAADEPVHRLARREVLLHRFDRGSLVRRLLVGKRGLEGLDPVAVHVVGEARHRLAPGLRVEECRGEVRDRALGVQLVLRPLLAVQAVEPHLLPAHPDVAREEVCVGRRHVEHAAVRVLDREDLAPDSVYQYLRRADVAPHAVVDVHHVLPGLDVVEVGETLPAGDRGIAPVVDLAAGEDAVRLRHDDEPADLEPAREVVGGHHQRSAPPCRRDVLLKALSRGVEELRMVRFLCAELGEAGQRRRLEVARGDAARSRVSGEHPGRERARLPESRGVVAVVLEREQRAAGWQQVQKRLYRAGFPLPPALGGGQQLAGVNSADRQLRRRVEGSQALQLVAEELGADRELVAWAPGVHDAAPHRVVALLLHERSAPVAQVRETGGERGEPEAAAAGRERNTCGRRAGGHWRGERGKCRHHHAGPRRDVARAQRRNRLQARAQGGLVAVQRRRELQNAHIRRSHEAQVVGEAVGVRQARRDCEDQTFARERDCEEGVRRAGQGRNAKGPASAGGPSGEYEVRGEQLACLFHRRR